MRESHLSTVLAAASLALFMNSRVPAQTPAPVPPEPVSRPDLEADAVKAVAARKQRCRLHPGTCTRDRPPPKPAAPAPAPASPPPA